MELPRPGEGAREQRMECGREFFEALGNPDVTGGEVTATATITPQSSGTWHLHIHVYGKVESPCDRCLCPLDIDVDDDFDTTVREGLPSEMEDEDIAVAPGSQTIDLTRPIADTVVLAIPLRHVHAEGECDTEMLEALSRRSPEPGSGGNPFDILTQLLDSEDQD